MLFWILIGVLAVFVLALYGSFRYAFYVGREQTLNPSSVPDGIQYRCLEKRILSAIEYAKSLPCEEVSIRSHDGLLLKGRYYESSPGAPLQIMFHGYRSNPLRDFCGGLPMALENGYNVLLVCQRGHEKSEGKCLSLGILERKDCVRWAEYARDRFGAQTPIFLMGISMGAATVMMASELELPDNVVGIIADCGYTSPKEIILEVMRSIHFPAFLIYPLGRLAGMIFGGFDIESASAVEALKRCRVPVLFIHGEDDRFVPCWMSRKNYAACTSEKRLFTVPDAAHAVCFFTDEAGYRSAVQSFVKDCLSN